MERKRVYGGRLLKTESSDAFFKRDDIVSVKSDHVIILPYYKVYGVYFNVVSKSFMYLIDPYEQFDVFSDGLILPEDRLILIRRSHEEASDSVEYNFKTDNRLELVS